MEIRRRIKELVSRLKSTKQMDNTFVFPYSKDPYEKREQIWSNLQKGLLLEEQQILIHWETPFNQLYKYKEKRRDSGDRTTWYFGKHQILDGYESHLEGMMWMYRPWTNPITEISENLGYDIEGNKNFLDLKERISLLLGEPSFTELEKWGNFDLGEIKWVNGRIRIALVGIEHFNCRYSLSIGLIEDQNEKYHNQLIEEIKVRHGLTDEDLGK